MMMLEVKEFKKLSLRLEVKDNSLAVQSPASDVAAACGIVSNFFNFSNFSNFKRNLLIFSNFKTLLIFFNFSNS